MVKPLPATFGLTRAQRTDDLFINFDDERAAASFRVLGQLGIATQVLFFTHHAHLVKIARTTLGSKVPVLALE